MKSLFLRDFSREVRGERPSAKTVDKYIREAIKYFDCFSDFPFDTVAVEEKVDFTVNDKQFVGFIDYIGEKDGELYIVDNKSRALKPRSKRKNPTLNDLELDKMLRQLYLYSAAVKQKYGKFPKALCFNCFRTGVFIQETFDIDRYQEAIQWAAETINTIKNTTDFLPNIEFFGCKYICSVNNECCYWQRGR